MLKVKIQIGWLTDQQLQEGCVWEVAPEDVVHSAT